MGENFYDVARLLKRFIRAALRKADIRSGIVSL